MKKQPLLKWLKALESGNYTSSVAKLRTSQGYCPLGILCELSMVGKWEEFEITEELVVYSYFNETQYLPKEVSDWAGLTEKERKLMIYFVMSMHDQKVPMNEIAKYLRLQYRVNSEV